MKSIKFRFLLVAIFLLLPSAAYSQGSGSYPAPQQSPSQESRGDDPNFVVTRSVSGLIVGLKEGILTLKTDKNKEVRIALNKGTVYKLGKKKIDQAELEESMFSDGRPIKIFYKAFNHTLVECRLVGNRDLAI